MEDQKTIFRRLKDQVDKSTYQKDLHFADDASNETSIRTQFMNIKRKETWTYRTNLKLDCTGDISNPDFITYKVRVLPFHALRYTVVIQSIPAITAAPGFEICWAPNLATNCIQSATFKVNDTEFQSLNSEYFDDHCKKINKTNDKDLNYEIGNISELVEWSSYLPSYQTLFNIPWFFNQHSSKSFPLDKCGKEDVVVIETQLKRSLSQLIRVRRADTKKEVTFDESYLSANTPMTLPVPEIRGEYIMKSDMECEHDRCEETQQKYSSNVFDIDNVRMIESDNIYAMNNTVNIKIKDMPFPVHTIHWKAVNLEARKYNNLSNYTTNAFDNTIGGNPIKWVSLSTPNGILFKNQDFYVGERIVPKFNFNKVPHVAGYGCWTNATDACDALYPKPGINLNESELTFRLENNDFSTESTFRIIIQLVYTYRITIKDYPKSENERNTKGIDFEISGDM